MNNYDIVISFDINEFVEEVNQRIKEGFIPIGGMIEGTNGNTFKQTMFKPNIKQAEKRCNMNKVFLVYECSFYE